VVSLSNSAASISLGIGPFVRPPLLLIGAMAFALGCDGSAARGEDGPSGVIEVEGMGYCGPLNPGLEIISKANFDWARHSGLALARRDGKRGFIDRTGNVVIGFRFSHARQFSCGLAYVALDRHHSGYIDPAGQWCLGPFKEWSRLGDFSEGLASFREVARAGEGARYGYMNLKGAVALKPRFESAHLFSEGLAAIKIDGLWGYIDHAGKTVVEPRFEEARPFCEGRALVKHGGRYGFIDHVGRPVIEAQFLQAVSFRDGIALVAREENEELIEIDHMGQRTVRHWPFEEQILIEE
jgi:hypothetical protein